VRISTSAIIAVRVAIALRRFARFTFFCSIKQDFNAFRQDDNESRANQNSAAICVEESDLANV
jgi:hypothetical protein